MKLEGKNYCVWKCINMIYEEQWNTECGNSLYLLDGEFEDRKYKFCPYCGRQLIVDEERKR